MRVLHLIPNLHIGGSQRLLTDLVSGLNAAYPEMCNEVAVLGSREDINPGYGLLDVHVVDFRGDYRNPRHVAAGTRQVRALLDARKPSIVQSYLWLADVLAAGAVRGTPTAHLSYVLDCRNWLASKRFKHRLRKLFTRYRFRQAGTRFVAVSDHARRYAIRHLDIPECRIAVAHNSILIANFEEGKPKDRVFTFGSLCRLEDEKGIPLLVDAVEMLGAEFDGRLRIGGTGPLHGSLRDRLEIMASTGLIDLVGPVPSAVEFYASLDCFVVPSIDSEGLPGTILEAMASRLPILATDVGGAVEAVLDGDTGRIVGPRDVAQLAAALRWFTEHRRAAAAMGAAGRARVEAYFGMDRLIREMHQTYVSMCGDG